MFRITATTTFDSAHFLLNTETACDNLHGHRWEVKVTLKSDSLNQKGFVLNFTTLKKWLKDITEGLDHSLLNSYIYQPTAENMCFKIFQQVHKKLWHYNKRNGLNIEVEDVTIAETQGNTASFSCRDINIRAESARRAAYKMWADEATRDNMVKGLRKANEDPILRKLRSDRMIENNPMSNRDTVEKMLVSLKKSNKLSPNKQEQELINTFELEGIPLTFVGNGDFMLGGKIPDFVNHDKKVIVEYFGRFWHSKNEWYDTKDDSEERIKFFASYGYKCLIIWSDDWKKNKELQISKVKELLK